MTAVLIWMMRGVLLLAGALVLVWLFGPREPADVTVRFDPATIGPDVDAYLAAREARFSDITPGTEKRVVWAGERGARAPVAVVYLPGFSATSEEIRPVPDRLAQAFSANLVFTRWTGHGQPGGAMAGPSVRDWMEDTAEALAIGRMVGERVIVVATSTGATWMTILAAQPGAADGVAGVAMVSPNFGIRNPAARLLTWPLARLWVPLVAGRELSYEARSDAHARFWTTAYPTVAALPMAAGVKAAVALDHGQIDVPALFLFDPRDQVVDPGITLTVAEAWGGPVRIEQISVGEGDDSYAHVIAGDILSPGQTDRAAEILIGWAKGL